MIKRIKNITTLASENKKVILRHILTAGGITLGLVAGVLLANNAEEPCIEGEVVEDETIEVIFP